MQVLHQDLLSLHPYTKCWKDGDLHLHELAINIVVNKHNFLVLTRRQIITLAAQLLHPRLRSKGLCFPTPIIQLEVI